MSKSIKPIGHVVPLSTGGYVVRVTRYGNGRLLPEPRLLCQDDGRPFASGLAALDALNLWKAAPRAVDRITTTSPVPAKPAAPRAPDVPLVNHALDYEEEHRAAVRRRKAKAVKRVPAEVTKITMGAPRRTMPQRDKDQLLIASLIASGAVTVTRCLPGMRQSDSRNPRRGGQLPAHLDPVTLS